MKKELDHPYWDRYTSPVKAHPYKLEIGPAFLPDTIMSAYEEPRMIRGIRSLASFCAIGLLILAHPAVAGGLAPGPGNGQQGSEIPTCFDGGHSALAVNNVQVDYWRVSSPNQFHSRAHIRGALLRIYQDQGNHSHFSVQIGVDDKHSVEVIYNQEFGNLPQLKVGDEVEACGDYITASAPHGRYPASPDGALVHWVHRSTRDGHESGYVAIAGVVYGH